MLENLAASYQSDPTWTHFLFMPSAALLRVAAIMLAAGLLWTLARMVLNRTLGKSWSEHAMEVAHTVVASFIWGLAALLGVYAVGLDLTTVGSSPKTLALMRVAFVLLAASVLAPLARRGLVGVVGKHWSPQQAILSRRAITYVVWGLAGTTALSEIGFDLRFLLGTAGFATFAITYSGQTSLSNIITGLFLIAEQPFVIGDTITVNGITGEVLSVDLLSVKLRTADNLFVRLPNESVLRNNVTNVSHFPIRRLDITISVGYGEDLTRVQRVLTGVSSRNPLGLEDPKPIFMLVGYGDNGIDLQYSVWGRKETFLDLKNSMYIGIKRAFDQANIEIPFPHRALVVGAGQPAMRLEMLANPKAPAAALPSKQPSEDAEAEADALSPSQVRS